ncbi:hypothetical protein CRG98_039999 [Punica granatum]|uniref:Uncharacterized protein n=1 Tax=Punica granatum TaxID=22663 RepID=A0A2I0I692_PUNGR|nr:hypothetical protein CRG98_039999 [Punica granatum]
MESEDDGEIEDSGFLISMAVTSGVPDRSQLRRQQGLRLGFRAEAGREGVRNRKINFSLMRTVVLVEFDRHAIYT